MEIVQWRVLVPMYIFCMTGMFLGAFMGFVLSGRGNSPLKCAGRRAWRIGSSPIMGAC